MTGDIKGGEMNFAGTKRVVTMLTLPLGKGRENEGWIFAADNSVWHLLH